MSKTTHLAQPLKIGNITLKNRIIMSPMTRSRAEGTVPNDLLVQYYSQRAGAGLIVTEGIMVTSLGSEWPGAPGIWNEEQTDAWKKVTAAVHAKGGLIFGQIWHIGRVAHPLHQGGQPALAPSNVGAKGGKFRLLVGEPGYVSNPKPIPNPWTVVEQYKNAYKNAKAAGFDGVEVHAANGYLPNQFLEAHSNKRTDEWGGSAQKRAKFVLEIVKAAIEVFGDSKRVGIKLSPAGGYNDMGDPKDVMLEEYTYLINELNNLDIGYITITRYNEYFDQAKRGTPLDTIATFGPLVKKPVLIANTGFTGPEADAFVESGKAAAIAFGTPYIVNPDLAERLINGHPVATNIDYSTLYGSDVPSKGYTDYPAFKQ
ncbi:hypothetical protein EDD86DRAFT_204916 [Gorgonomyces haynaldii]|nr:hypothetical protein EDD86DRAFT_204916 [Gorgonomyces haynaldii]